jgi:uncharacterized repeat protein (TIGR01451 family)
MMQSLMRHIGIKEPKCLASLCICMLATFLGASAVAATGDVSLDPATSEELVGNTFTREVMIDVGADVLSNYTLFLTFDPAVVEVTAINGGNTAEFADFVLTNIDNAAGEAQFTQVNIDTVSPTGIVSVANIEFEAVGESVPPSALTLEVSSIGVSPDGGTITTQVQAASVTVPGPPINDADLEISKVVSTPTAPIGDEVVYTITVTNNGPMAAQNVSITESVPIELPVVSVSGCTGPLSDCVIGDIAVDAAAQVFVTVSADMAGDFENTVTVQADSTDPTSANDTASAMVTIVPLEVDLTIQKTSDTFVAKRGDIVNYTITVTNEGSFTADDVTVTDDLPAGLTFISTTGCNEDPDGVPICGLGTLEPGETKEFTLTAQVGLDVLGAIENIVSVTSLQDDANTFNNEASFTLAVVRDTYCEARPLIVQQLVDINAAALGSPEGLPIDASLALIDLVLCNVAPEGEGYPELAAATENAYQINQDLIEGSMVRGVTDISDIQEAVAILVSISAEVQTATLNLIQTSFGISLTGPFEIVTESDGMFMPSRIQGIPLFEDYLVFSNETLEARTITEPYSGLHDLDADGFTNAEEYETVVVIDGGTLEDFAFAASDIPRVVPGGGGGGGGSCLISTAARGTSLAPRLDSLRTLRDDYLMTNAVGAALVDTYYTISPPVANLIARHDKVRFGSSVLLAPVISTADFLVATSHPLGTLTTISFLAIGMLACLLRRRSPKR